MDAQQAKQWLNAFNQRDVEAILSHYSEDVEFLSPLVVKLVGEASGKIKGRQRQFVNAIRIFSTDFVGRHRTQLLERWN